MADKNFTLSGSNTREQLQQARDVLHKSSQYVIEMFEDKGDQMFALASALADQLTPADPKNPPDDWPINAWRLAQVLEGLLSNPSERQTARAMLLGE